MFGETAGTLQLEIENNQYFLEKGRYLIGNDRRTETSRNYIQVSNLFVDAKHCVLEVDSNEEIFIVDLESDSGVYINNKRVDPLTKKRLKPDEDFSLGEQLKAKIILIEREESHNGNHLENIPVIKDVMPRPIAKDDRVQQLNLQNRISHNNYDGVNVPAVETHQSISTSSAARASNMDNSVNQNSPNEDQEVVDFHTAQISEVKIEYPDCGDYNFVQSVPMIRIVRIDGRENDSAQLIGKKTEKTKNVETLVPHVKSSSQQAERAQTSHAMTSFLGCGEYSIQNNNKSKQVTEKSLENKATNISKRANQNPPNGDQEVANFHTVQIPEVKIEYPDSGDYNFVQSVPMIRIVRIGGVENDSAQLIGKKTEKTKNVETLVPRVKSSSQQAERAQTSHATTSFQGSIQNNNKIKEIAKKGLGSKEAVAEREKESNQSSSNGEVESSLASGSIVLKTNKKTNLSLKNFTTQKIPRFSTLEREPNLSNELLQNNEFENTLPKRLTRSQTRKQETNTTHEMPGRRLTRSQTQDGALFSELGAKGIQTQIVDATRSNVPKKKRKTSLPLPSDDVAAQPLAHSMETRARLRNTNWPSSSNANNAGNSGNVGKRKGGAKFNSKKSQYPKKKD